MWTLVREIRRAWRALITSPRFSVTSVATLALGIGASSAIFSVVHPILLRPLPYPNPSSIVQLWQVNDEGGSFSFSRPNFEDIRDRSRSFALLARYRSSLTSVTGDFEPTRVNVGFVTKDFFGVLETPPMLGRTFVAEETERGGRAASVVSFGFWQRYLGGVGELTDVQVTLGGRSHAVVGVMPPSFDLPTDVSVWSSLEVTESGEASRTAHNDRVIGRLAPGVAIDRARAEVSVIARELRSEHGDDTWMVDASVVALQEQLVSGVRPALMVLSGAVGFLFLVACANVVNLQLARVASRHTELSISAALGASRVQLLRPLLAESTLLALAGGAWGTMVAAWGVRALLAFEPGNLPRAHDVGVDGSVLLFALGVSAAAAFLLALSALARAWKTNLQDSLRGKTRSYGSDRIRRTLVVTQVGLTLVLLVGAGLLGKSLWRLLDVEPGFRIQRTLVVDLNHDAPRSGEQRAQLSQLHNELLTRIAALPGVQRAGAVDRLPMSTGYRSGQFLVVKPGEALETFEDFARLARDPERLGEAEYRAATSDYFPAAGIPLREGRLFGESDGLDAPHVALISQSLAKERWPLGDALGAFIEFGNMDGDLRLLRVVGIVGDVRHGGLDAEPAPTIYVNARQRPPANVTVVVETDAVAAAVPAVRAVVRDLAPEIPPRFRTMGAVVDDTLSSRRFNLILVGVFAASALGLALMGVYGVIALGVSQRVRELGLRIALGASEADVLRLIVGQGLRLTGIGVAFGTAVALGLSRFLESLLFEVAAMDPATVAAVAVPLTLAAMLACYVPARRAARTDPMVALREE